jgi:hypothetical protein
VFSAVVPPCWAVEAGGSQVMWNSENFFILCFVCSQLGAGQGNTSPWLWSNVMSLWSISYPTKVSFKNTFSFRCFYIHCTCPPQAVVWKRDGQSNKIVGAQQCM